MNNYATRETGVKRNKTEHKVCVVKFKELVMMLLS
jgi:hypothetical protein